MILRYFYPDDGLGNSDDGLGVYDYEKSQRDGGVGVYDYGKS